MRSDVPFIKQAGFENSQLQENLVQKINILTKIPFLSGTLIQSAALVVGDNKIAHKLGRKYQGWFLTKIDAGIVLYQVASNDDENIFLTLNASAPAVVDVWVF